MSTKALTKTFFNERTEASRIKSTIVSKYLNTWASVLSKWAHKLVYADFFAGCGRYDDGSPSTPLEAITNVAGREGIKHKVQFVFNEWNGAFCEQLRENIASHILSPQLVHQPIIQNQSFDELPALVQLRNWLHLKPGAAIPPSLVFVDPWGYKGLSLEHLGHILQNKGCEVIFFFNYNRINGAINNPCVKEHMDFLFGEVRAASLRLELAKKPPQIREGIILKAVKEQLQRAVHPQRAFVQDFKFKKGKRISHFVIFATTHPTGFSLIKEIMATESASYSGGVPTYESGKVPVGGMTQISLFEGIHDGLTPLGDDLMKVFSKKTLTHKELYDKHQVTGPFTKRNYKDILLRLEETSKVIIDPERSKRRLHKGTPTLSEDVMVTFP